MANCHGHAERVGPSWRQRSLGFLRPVGFTIVAFLVFGNSLHAPFVFDDIASIVENETLDSLSWRNAWHQQRGFAYLTFACNRRWSGLDTTAYRVTNVAIHVLAAWALSGLVRLSLRRPPWEAKFGRHAEALAWISGLIWLVHPLQTESVTYIVQRLESLMGCTFLLGLYALARARESRRAWLWYLGSLTCLALGCRTKEAMVVAPVVYVLYDRVFQADGWREVWRRGAYYSAMGAIWLLAFAPLSLRIVGHTTSEASAHQPSQNSWAPKTLEADHELGVVRDVTPWSYMVSQPRVVLHYLLLTFWPQNLCIDYVWPLAESPAAIIGPSLVVLGSLALTGWLIWAQPPWGFWAAWFFLTLAPRSTIIPRSDLAVEHRMYLPLAAVAVMVPLLAYAVLARRHRERVGGRVQSWQWLGLTTAALVIAALGSRTWLRNEDYRTPLALWTQTVAQAPRNPRAMTNLGMALADSGRTDEAIEWYQRAIAQPSLLQYDQYALFNLGNAWVQKRQYVAAVSSFGLAIQVRPDFAEAYNNLAYAYLQLGQAELAARCSEKAVALQNDYAGAHLNCAIAARRLGRLEQAEFHLQQVVKLEPDSVDALTRLADLTHRRGRASEALKHYEHALRFRPQDAVLLTNYALLLENVGRLGEAARAYQSALEQEPQFVEARLHLAACWAQQGRLDEAASQYQRVLRIRPRHVAAHNNLANLLVRLDMPEQAILHYRQALLLDPQFEPARRNLNQVLSSVENLSPRVPRPGHQRPP